MFLWWAVKIWQHLQWMMIDSHEQKKINWKSRKYLHSIISLPLLSARQNPIYDACSCSTLRWRFLFPFWEYTQPQRTATGLQSTWSIEGFAEISSETPNDWCWLPVVSPWIFNSFFVFMSINSTNASKKCSSYRGSVMRSLPIALKRIRVKSAIFHSFARQMSGRRCPTFQTMLFHLTAIGGRVLP